jgi:hypothetical protein
VDFAALEPRLAGTAIAAFAAVRQIERSVPCRVEQRLLS